MSRQFEIVISAIGLPLHERELLKQCVHSMHWSCSPGANGESYWCKAEVPATMSDAEAAHHLGWHASDLAKLKFKVFSRSLIWKDGPTFEEYYADKPESLATINRAIERDWE